MSRHFDPILSKTNARRLLANLAKSGLEFGGGLPVPLKKADFPKYGKRNRRFSFFFVSKLGGSMGFHYSKIANLGFQTDCNTFFVGRFWNFHVFH